MSVNKTKKRQSTKHKNFMGGDSYDIRNPILALRTIAASCFFGEPQYYEDGKMRRKEMNFGRSYYVEREFTHFDYCARFLGESMPREWQNQDAKTRMESAIDRALDYSVEATLEEAARLRNESLIRVTPQVILVRAAMHPKAKGTGLITRYAPQIIKRADEPATGMAYLMSAYPTCVRRNGKVRIPNALKKAWRNFLANCNEYQLAKYRMENREVKTVDVVNLVRPTATVALNKLIEGTLKTSGLTWESIRSSGGSWEDAFKVMGHMALLRNLRNLAQDDSVPASLIANTLVEGAPKGKQLPFRYVSAYYALKNAGVNNPVILDGVEDALEASMVNLPKIKGKTISLCDNSGSAQGTTQSSMGTMKVSTIANLTGVITGKVSDEAYVGVFGDGLTIVPVRKNASTFDTLGKCEQAARSIGQSTENGIWVFFEQALRTHDHYDNIFIYSDMQAGHGGLYGMNPHEYSDYVWGKGGYGSHINVPALIKKYREEVNPNVKVFLVQVAGYQDTLVPECYPNTYILGGWSDGIIRFAAEMNQLQQ